MYREEIKELVANLRKDLNLPCLVFVAGGIAPWIFGSQAAENIRIFNKMISHIADFIPNTACASSEGLMPLIDDSDSHFCTDSQVVWRERYVQKVLENASVLHVLFIGDSVADGNREMYVVRSPHLNVALEI